MTVETMEISFDTTVSGHGIASFVDVEASFDVDWERPDRGVGVRAWTARAEFIGFSIGSLVVTRDMLAVMLSNAEVCAIEARAVEFFEDNGSEL